VEGGIEGVGKWAARCLSRPSFKFWPQQCCRLRGVRLQVGGKCLSDGHINAMRQEHVHTSWFG